MRATVRFPCSCIPIGSRRQPSYGGVVIQPLKAGARALGNYFQRVKRTIGIPEVFRTRSCSYTVAACFFLVLPRVNVYTLLLDVSEVTDFGRCAWSSDGTRILYWSAPKCWFSLVCAPKPRWVCVYPMCVDKIHGIMLPRRKLDYASMACLLLPLFIIVSLPAVSGKCIYVSLLRICVAFGTESVWSRCSPHVAARQQVTKQRWAPARWTLTC